MQKREAMGIGPSGFIPVGLYHLIFSQFYPNIHGKLGHDLHRVFLTTPLFLNYYTPTWNTLLKHTPILQSSSQLIRWVSLYIPVVILLAAVGFDRTVSLRQYQPSLVILSLAVVVLLNSSAEKKSNPSDSEADACKG